MYLFIHLFQFYFLFLLLFQFVSLLSLKFIFISQVMSSYREDAHPGQDNGVLLRGFSPLTFFFFLFSDLFIYVLIY